MSRRELFARVSRPSPSSSPLASGALKRLVRDYRDFVREQGSLVGIWAAPVSEDNMFEWHINLQACDGPLSKALIHCVMEFSQDYPLVAPKIRCSTPFGHRHVFGGYICLSMLTGAGSVYERWTSAYSITSILVQLQSFFFDPNKLYGRDHSGTVLRCREFTCVRCGHTHKSPFPRVTLMNEVHEREEPTTAQETVNVSWVDMARDCTAIVLSYLDAISLHCANWTCREWNAVCERHNVQAQREMRCYHSKEHFSECILGFGMSGISAQRNNAYKLHMDYLSYDSWTTGAKKSVWGEDLVHWIPLMINSSHGERAYTLLIQHLKTIHYNPLTALAKLMNGIVISLAKNVTDYDQTMLMSEKALIGYFSLHHCLLWLVAHDERMRQDARRRVQGFRSNDHESWSKTCVPDLGEALVYLSCVDGVSWEDVSQSVLFEVWTRNVLWYTKSNPLLNWPSAENMKEIFESTRVSRTIVQFQVFFLSVVTAADDTATMLSNYNMKLGRPSRQSIRGLGRFCSEIARQKTQRWAFNTQYSFYWQSLNILVPSQSDFVEFLAKTVQASAQAKYHSFPRVERSDQSRYSRRNERRFRDHDGEYRRQSRYEHEDEDASVVSRRGSRRFGSGNGRTRWNNRGGGESSWRDSRFGDRRRGGGGRGRGRGRYYSSSSSTNSYSYARLGADSGY